MYRGKIIILGGTGFVGSHIAALASKNNFHVILGSRRGIPSQNFFLLKEKNISFLSIDAFDRSQVFQLLKDHSDAIAIINCIGFLFSTTSPVKDICDPIMSHVGAALHKYSELSTIRNLIFISAARMYPLSRYGFLHKYYERKRMSEKVLLKNFSDRSTILRPGFIYGNRYIFNGRIILPLQLIGKPLQIILNPLYSLFSIGLLTPPISALELAYAVLISCVNDNNSKVDSIAEYKDIRQLAKDGRLFFEHSKSQK